MTRTLAAMILGALLTVTACAGHPHRSPTLPVDAGGTPVVYAAIGASETVGEGTDNPIRDAWPQVFFRTALPTSAAFLNFAIPGVGISTAVEGELPQVRDVHPNLVTVWLNVDDLLHGVPAATYEGQLRSLVAQLRAAGALVLVANTPPVDLLPAYRSCVDPALDPDLCPPGVARPVPSPVTIAAEVDAYNGAIARVAAEEGATVVDLHTPLRTAASTGRLVDLIGVDGISPSAAGARLVAAQFAAALHAARAGRSLTG